MFSNPTTRGHPSPFPASSPADHARLLNELRRASSTCIVTTPPVTAHRLPTLPRPHRSNALGLLAAPITHPRSCTEPFHHEATPTPRSTPPPARHPQHPAPPRYQRKDDWTRRRRLHVDGAPPWTPPDHRRSPPRQPLSSPCRWPPRRLVVAARALTGASSLFLADVALARDFAGAPCHVPVPASVPTRRHHEGRPKFQQPADDTEAPHPTRVVPLFSLTPTPRSQPCHSASVPDPPRPLPGSSPPPLPRHTAKPRRRSHPRARFCQPLLL